MAVRFLAVGELLVDVIAAGAGHGARIRVRPAGSAFNAAVAAAAAGADAAVIGTVGDDAAGRMILARAGRARCPCRGRRSRRGRPGRSCSPTARSVSTAASLTTSSSPIRSTADAVLVSGYVPAAAEALASAEADLVALDAARLSELPPGGNAVFANEETARRLTGRNGEQAVRVLGERYRLACVTSGEDGAVAILDGRLEAARRGSPSTRTRWGPVTRSQRRCSSGWPAADDLGRALRDGCRAAERRSRTGSSARRRGSCPRPRLDLVPGRRYTSGVNLALSLLYAAERHPDAEAVVDGGARLTYAELRERAARLAGGLEREGLRRGDRLAAVVRSRHESVHLYWACQWLGATFVPLSPRVSAADLAYCREDSGAALFLEADAELQALLGEEHPGALDAATRTRA